MSFAVGVSVALPRLEMAVFGEGRAMVVGSVKLDAGCLTCPEPGLSEPFLCLISVKVCASIPLTLQGSVHYLMCAGLACASQFICPAHHGPGCIARASWPWSGLVHPRHISAC